MFDIRWLDWGWQRVRPILFSSSPHQTQTSTGSSKKFKWNLHSCSLFQSSFAWNRNKENAEKQRTTKALQIFNIIKPSFARTHLTHYSCNQADVTVIYYTIYCMLNIILYLNTSSPLVKQLSSVQAYSETHKSHVDNLSLVRAVQTFLSVQFLLRLIVVIYFIVSPT